MKISITAILSRISDAAGADDSETQMRHVSSEIEDFGKMFP
jgi:hypothetical protein